MNQLTKMTLVMTIILITPAGVVSAAGRGVDNPAPLHKVTNAGNGGSVASGVIYAGRPNDSITFPRLRSSEGQAEFAVMEMQDVAVPRNIPVHFGRPMDNPPVLIR